MEISLENFPESIKEISVNDFNIYATKQVKERYKSVRQMAKAPAFALT